MNTVRVCDSTVRKLSAGKDYSLSFKEKLEVVKLLNKLNIDVIELDEIRNQKVDTLLAKSVVTAADNSIIAMPVRLGVDPSITAKALSDAKQYRLQVIAPASSVRMEYVYHKKPAALLEAILKQIEECVKYTKDVELIIDDATRGDFAFVKELISKAVEKGVSTVTFCDDAGTMLPEEFVAFLEERLNDNPELKEINWGVSCSNELAMADACAIAAINHGAGEIKASAYPVNTASLENICKVIAGKGDILGVRTNVENTSLRRVLGQVCRFCGVTEDDSESYEPEISAEISEDKMRSDDSKETVIAFAEKLGYILSEEDSEKVYEAFVKLAAKKEFVSARELDAIISTNAMQVPAKYELVDYMASTGNSITPMVSVKLRNSSEVLEGISLGAGPVDAALLAIESITGKHFEVDDFQLHSASEGKDAAGETLIKLRAGGKIYSGRGVSTDIIGAGIRAYLNALNKILYEEEE